MAAYSPKRAALHYDSAVNLLRGYCCSTGGRGPCDSFGVTYEIKCQTCEQKYVGETARSAFTRGKEHLDGMDRDVSQSVLRRHANDCHNGVIPDYVMNVTGVYHGDAMLRQITESIKIRREGSINNKTEWNSITLLQSAIVK